MSTRDLSFLININSVFIRDILYQWHFRSKRFNSVFLLSFCTRVIFFLRCSSRPILLVLLLSCVCSALINIKKSVDLVRMINCDIWATAAAAACYFRESSTKFKSISKMYTIWSHQTRNSKQIRKESNGRGAASDEQKKTSRTTRNKQSANYKMKSLTKHTHTCMHAYSIHTTWGDHAEEKSKQKASEKKTSDDDHYSNRKGSKTFKYTSIWDLSTRVLPLLSFVQLFYFFSLFVREARAPCMALPHI